LNEVAEKLKAIARLHNRNLLDEQSRVTAQNREIETNIQTQIQNGEKEIGQLRESLAAKGGEKQQLADRVRKCECRNYAFQIEEQRPVLSRVTEEVSAEKEKIVQSERNEQSQLSDARIFLKDMETENAEVGCQLKQLPRELEEPERAARTQLQALQDQHQNEIQMIGIRVRQTVEKKDSVIQQLMNRLDSLGATAKDF
jgi:hypothetical protein